MSTSPVSVVIILPYKHIPNILCLYPIFNKQNRTGLCLILDIELFALMTLEEGSLQGTLTPWFSPYPFDNTSLDFWRFFLYTATKCCHSQPPPKLSVLSNGGDSLVFVSRFDCCSDGIRKSEVYFRLAVFSCHF